jgi:hypothetical protein
MTDFESTRYDEHVEGWKDADTVYVSRALRGYRSALDVIIEHIREVAEGLSRPSLSARASYEDTADICVEGERPATDEERADRDRADRIAFLAAKARYEADKERFDA